jgi:hypothetical protein
MLHTKSLTKNYILAAHRTMSWYVPTSQALALLAQNRLLKHYVKSNYEVKSFNSLNYVVIHGDNKYKHHALVQNKKEKVLILMHGFGLGLGFFYGNILFTCS